MATTAQTGTTAKKKTAKAAPATSSTKTKATAKTAATVKKAPPRTAAARTPRGNGASGSRIDPAQRRNYIEVAAYYIAERRGFMGGNEADDWASAEAEIDRLLLEGKLNG